MYDVIFISYDEPLAPLMLENLLDIHPTVKQITGIKGIREAHIKAAQVSTTEMFYVVDGDCFVNENFNFAFKPPPSERLFSHVWFAENQVNQSVYGYGGIKLLNTKTVSAAATVDYVDFFSAVSKHGVKVIEHVGSITKFDQTPLMTFRAAMREVVKLTNQLKNDNEANSRLQQWLTDKPNTEFAQYYKAGVHSAHRFVSDNVSTEKINDFDYINTIFKEYCEITNPH